MKVIRKFEIVCEDKADAIDIERYLDDVSNINYGIQEPEDEGGQDEQTMILCVPHLYYQCKICKSVINSEKLDLEEGDVREGVICPVCKSNIKIGIIAGGKVGLF